MDESECRQRTKGRYEKLTIARWIGGVIRANYK